MTPVLTIESWAWLLSTHQGDIVISGSHTTQFGQHSFCSLVPDVWNDLSSELKNSDISRLCFKQGLKTWILMVPICSMCLWEHCLRGVLQICISINWLALTLCYSES